MSIDNVIKKEDDREFDQLVLEFSKSRKFSRPLYVPVAFEVAAGLRHPATTSKKRQVTASRKKATSQRKDRSRRKRRSRKRKS